MYKYMKKYIEIINKFPTEELAIEYFLKICFPNGICCYRCGHSKLYRASLKGFRCNRCAQWVSPFKDTIIEHSSIDLRKWFYTIDLLLNEQKKITISQLQYEIGLNYRSASTLAYKIRLAMKDENQRKFLSNFVFT
jgi:hypothetical protein